jgi:hypothetical protein
MSYIPRASHKDTVEFLGFSRTAIPDVSTFTEELGRSVLVRTLFIFFSYVFTLIFWHFVQRSATLPVEASWERFRLHAKHVSKIRNRRHVQGEKWPIPEAWTGHEAFLPSLKEIQWMLDDMENMRELSYILSPSVTTLHIVLLRPTAETDRNLPYLSELVRAKSPSLRSLNVQPVFLGERVTPLNNLSGFALSLAQSFMRLKHLAVDQEVFASNLHKLPVLSDLVSLGLYATLPWKAAEISFSSAPIVMPALRRLRIHLGEDFSPFWHAFLPIVGQSILHLAVDAGLGF